MLSNCMSHKDLEFKRSN
uniref:Uncharacterized protein n=1 Tax=Rhizophora mucronata TaxID=61149 RepID=A0A2P2N822_RHIMU